MRALLPLISTIAVIHGTMAGWNRFGVHGIQERDIGGVGKSAMMQDDNAGEFRLCPRSYRSIFYVVTKSDATGMNFEDAKRACAQYQLVLGGIVEGMRQSLVVGSMVPCNVSTALFGSYWVDSPISRVMLPNPFGQDCPWVISNRNDTGVRLEHSQAACSAGIQYDGAICQVPLQPGPAVPVDLWPGVLRRPAQAPADYAKWLACNVTLPRYITDDAIDDYSQLASNTTLSPLGTVNVTIMINQGNTYNDTTGLEACLTAGHRIRPLRGPRMLRHLLDTAMSVCDVPAVNGTTVLSLVGWHDHPVCAIVSRNDTSFQPDWAGASVSLHPSSWRSCLNATAYYCG
jgi:hypothetical protein